MDTHKVVCLLVDHGYTEQNAEGFVEAIQCVRLQGMITKTYLDERLSEFEERLELRFQLIDERFKRIDDRFEAIEKRFEVIDNRFETIDRRFDKIDRKFDRIDERFNDLYKFIILNTVATIGIMFALIKLV
jgi:chaperonin cofactor prefoldin